jgi:hypothetical protein
MLKVKFTKKRYTRVLPLPYSEIKCNRVLGHDPGEFVEETQTKLEGHGSAQCDQNDYNLDNRVWGDQTSTEAIRFISHFALLCPYFGRKWPCIHKLLGEGVNKTQQKRD